MVSPLAHIEHAVLHSVYAKIAASFPDLEHVRQSGRRRRRHTETARRPVDMARSAALRPARATPLTVPRKAPGIVLQPADQSGAP